MPLGHVRASCPLPALNHFQISGNEMPADSAWPMSLGLVGSLPAVWPSCAYRSEAPPGLLLSQAPCMVAWGPSSPTSPQLGQAWGTQLSQLPGTGGEVQGVKV